MTRPLALVVPLLFLPLAAVPAQQPKDKKLALQSVGEEKVEVKRHVHVLTFSPDGKQLAVGTEDVHLYDVSGEAAKAAGVLGARVGFGLRCITYTKDGKYLVFGGADNSVRVWDVVAKAETANAKSHRGDVLAAAAHPEGKLVATGSNDQTAILWNLGADGKLTEQSVLKAEDKFGSSVRSVAFAKVGKAGYVLVTASANGSLRTFSTTGVTKQTGLLKAKTSLGDANMTPNPAGTLWALSEREHVHLITSAGVPAGSFVAPGVGHKENVRDLSFSPDGKLLASASHDGILVVWDVATKAARYNKVRPGHFTSVAFSPYQNTLTGEYTLAAGLDDGNVHVIKLAYR